jgi:hypothetical protein
MKLYWRYKKDGKWTWKAANVKNGGATTMLTVWPHFNSEEEE